MPHFSGPSLAPSLAEAGLDYTHIPDLGGLRGPSTAPEYAGLPEAFRGYGAHMETPRFRAALDELIRLASEQRVALLCAEAEPKSCHRSLIADALFARGLEVAHIVDLGPPLPHELTRAAVIRDGRLSYPRKTGATRARLSVLRAVPAAARFAEHTRTRGQDGVGACATGDGSSSAPSLMVKFLRRRTDNLITTCWHRLCLRA
jgi:hypothetical protein